MRGFGAAGGKGLNVTVPHKEAAFALCGEKSAAATAAGAVNTISIVDGRLRRRQHRRRRLHSRRHRQSAPNARGQAHRRARRRRRRARHHRAVARAAARRAHDRRIGPRSAPTRSWRSSPRNRSSRARSPSSPSSRRTTCSSTPRRPGSKARRRRFRLRWSARRASATTSSTARADTPFVVWGKSHGAARAVHGWGMLVEQAAESFAIWRGVRPDTKPLLKQIPR